MDLKQGISYLERERGREGGGERETEIEGRYREIDGRNRKIQGRDRKIYGRNRKIEGRDREIEGRNIEIEGRNIEIERRDIETEKPRDRADNKNPKQSWVAQLVINKSLVGSSHQNKFSHLGKLLCPIEDRVNSPRPVSRRRLWRPKKSRPNQIFPDRGRKYAKANGPRILAIS